MFIFPAFSHFPKENNEERPGSSLELFNQEDYMDGGVVFDIDF